MQKDFFVKVVKIFQRSMDILCSRWNTWRRRTWAATWSASSRRELFATSSIWRLSIFPTTSALKYELELNMTSGMLKLCLRHNNHHCTTSSSSWSIWGWSWYRWTHLWDFLDLKGILRNNVTYLLHYEMVYCHPTGWSFPQTWSLHWSLVPSTTW